VVFIVVLHVIPEFLQMYQHWKSNRHYFRHHWCQDTSDPGHFGPKTFRHWCRSIF